MQAGPRIDADDVPLDELTPTRNAVHDLFVHADARHRGERRSAFRGARHAEKERLRIVLPIECRNGAVELAGRDARLDQAADSAMRLDDETAGRTHQLDFAAAFEGD